MVGTKEPFIVYLDTHAVMWLHDGLADRFSATAIRMIEQSRLFVSPIVELELAYLREIGRIRPKPQKVIESLASEIGLQYGDYPYRDVVRWASEQTWTRDPFDRLIVGETLAAGGYLITRDELIREHCARAVW